MQEEHPIEPQPSSEQSEPEPRDSGGSVPSRRGPSGLPALQELALQQLIAGTSIAEAARAARVDRRTIYRWLKSDPKFAAAYNAWQRETVASGRARMLAMTDLALNTVHNAMLQGDARVALQVAKANGAMDAPNPGTTDPKHFRRTKKLRDSRRERALGAAEATMREKKRDDDFPEFYRNPRRCEDAINWTIRFMLRALREETPEDRAHRLMSQPYSRNRYSPETRRVLALLDADLAATPAATAAPPPPVEGTVIAATSVAPDPASTAAPPSSPGVSAPAASPVPRAEPAAFQGPRNVSSKSAEPPAPAPPPRRPPPMHVAYDGSDDMDNEPGWVKII